MPPSVLFPMYNPDKFHDKKVYLHVYYSIIRGDTQTHKNSRKPLILLENLKVYGYIPCLRMTGIEPARLPTRS